MSLFPPPPPPITQVACPRCRHVERDSGSFSPADPECRLCHGVGMISKAAAERYLNGRASGEYHLTRKP